MDYSGFYLTLDATCVFENEEASIHSMTSMKYLLKTQLGNFVTSQRFLKIV